MANPDPMVALLLQHLNDLPLQCDVHPPQPREYYNPTNRQLICSQCRLVLPNPNIVIELTEPWLREWSQRCETFRGQLEENKTLLNIRERSNNIEEAMTQIRARFRQRRETIQQLVHQAELSLLEENDNQLNARANTIAQSLAILSHRLRAETAANQSRSLHQRINQPNHGIELPRAAQLCLEIEGHFQLAQECKLADHPVPVFQEPNNPNPLLAAIETASLHEWIDDPVEHRSASCAKHPPIATLPEPHEPCSSPADSKLDAHSDWHCFVPACHTPSGFFLQIRLTHQHSFVCGVRTKGSPTRDSWVSGYRIATTNVESQNPDDDSFITVDGDRVFGGNYNRDSPVDNRFTPRRATYVRIFPLVWPWYVALRAAVIVLLEP